MSADARLDRLEAFLAQFEQTLADAVARMESEDADEKAAASELATHLSDLTDAVKKLKPADLSGLIAAMRALRMPAPVVHVPQPLVQVLPAPAAPARTVVYEVVIPGRHGAADQRMTITRTERMDDHG